MKKLIFAVVSCLLSGAALAAAPAGSAAVSHPKTTVAVTHPKTNVVVTRPKTTAAVTHPTTSVTVSKPTTTVVVKHPQTPSATAEKNEQTKAEPTKQAVDNSTPAPAAKGSMMSSYQAPKAKDFKASKMGGGDAGLGKTNEAQKDAAAAQFKKPEALTLENALKGSTTSTSAITKSVEKKTK